MRRTPFEVDGKKRAKEKKKSQKWNKKGATDSTLERKALFFQNTQEPAGEENEANDSSDYWFEECGRKAGSRRMKGERR